MIWIVECPRIICNVLGFMPLSIHLVANVCLSVCGDNGLNCGSFKAILLKIYFITTVVSLGLIGVFFVVVNSETVHTLIISADL